MSRPMVKSSGPGSGKPPVAGMIEGEKLRILILAGIFLAAFLLLFFKLGYEQFRFEEKSNAAISRQSLRRIRIPARRGRIFTRDMVLLAGSSNGSNLIFYPEEMQVRNSRSRSVQYIFDAAEAASLVVGRPNPLSKEEINRHLNLRPGLPITVFENLSEDELARALEAGRNFRGVDMEADETRRYPEGSMAAHLIGYTNLQDPGQAADRGRFSYYIPDRIGVEGLERAFDRLPGTPPYDAEADGPEPGHPDRPLGLRGLPGYKLVEVDHLGVIRREHISRIEPSHGNNLILTLDSRAQRIAEKVISGRRAALVLLDAENGDILAAASNPTYDLAEGFTPRIRRDYYNMLRNDPELPLYNRALMGNYTPGSIMKPLGALAFLNEGISPDEVIDCDGYTSFGNVRIRCASRAGHGPLDMTGGLAKSCNDYMIELALRIKLEPIARMYAQAGIGRKTGVELPETTGVLPSPEAKRRRGGGAWTPHDTGLVAIGQGMITLSPLQAAVFTAALANGGTVWKPHLAYQMVDSMGNPLYEREPEAITHLEVGAGSLDIIRQGMFDVVNSPGGSGRSGFVRGLEIHGKTGSAQVGTEHNMTVTTWFIAFVTHEGRTYACSVMVEEGVGGGRDCAPVAARFFSEYLLNR